jgi:Ni,Fe-hydrogenase I small subunit
MGTLAFLHGIGSPAADKVINVPGCPTNPWWFVLSVVLFLVDLPGVALSSTVGHKGTLGTLIKVAPDATYNEFGIGINSTAVDGDRRLTMVYGISVHSTSCPRYRYYANGVFATYPGDAGCLQKLGCKGMATSSLCGVHGWNAQQPTNAAVIGDISTQGLATANPGPISGYQGGHCTRAGHPCMGCTEHGYPDNFVPFVVRS